jgi:hypothetical protein
LLATFADDTAVLTKGRDFEEAAVKAQKALLDITNWTKKWRIKLNQQKSAHINFTYKQNKKTPLEINGQPIPFANEAKYLGMNLDVGLKWKAHIKKKKDELKIRRRNLSWLIGRRSQMTINNKLLIYKQILRPVWQYGAQIWGCSKPSNINIIQRFQNKVLRGIVDAPCYVRNSDLHRNLNIESVTDIIKKMAQNGERRLHNHPNTEGIQLLNYREATRRLNRTKPLELC